MAYVALLILLVVITTLGLAFLLQAGIESSATLARSDGLQAEYLAEAAVNHAAWRLQNEPGFPASQTVYYMHSLGNGRYGYKVRPFTNTTFATVATIGAVGQSVVRQSYVLGKPVTVSDIICAYGPDNNATPAYRDFEGPGWGEETPSISVGRQCYWVQLAASPDGNELIMVTLDEDSDVNAAVYDGETWGNQWELTNASDRERKVIDVVYESQSGEALVLFRGSTRSNLYYSTWNGTSWSPNPAAQFNPAGTNNDVEFITAAADPFSDEILIAILDLDADITIVRWTGSAMQQVAEVETSASHVLYQPAGIAYEQASGDALIFWGESDGDYDTAIWNGTALLDQPAVTGSDRIRHVRMASDPRSDYIAIAAVDEASDLNIRIWNGASMADSAEKETSMEDRDWQCFDVAWEPSGQQALFIWGRSTSTSLMYLEYTKGVALSGTSVQTGPNMGSDPKTMRCMATGDGDEIIALVCNDVLDLKSTVWDGDTFIVSPPDLLHNNLEEWGRRDFDLAGGRIAPAVIGGSGLVAHWALDENSGTTAADSTGNGHNGTLTNMDPLTDWVAGRVGGALDFDGTNDYVTSPNAADMQFTNALTIAGWVNGDSWGSGTDVDIIVRKGEANPNNYQLAIESGYVAMHLDGNDGSGFRGTTYLSTNVWYHVAGTWDGAEVRIYVNGVLNNTPAARTGTINADTRAIYVGGRSGTDLLNGTLDDVRVYNRALSATEIAELYDLGN